jgi:hypothetical protein
MWLAIGEVAQMRKQFMSILSTAVIAGALVALVLSAGAELIGPGI